MQELPRARTDGLVFERVDDDLVIYDQRSQTAHSLSGATACVWEHCDGRRCSLDIAGELSLEPEMVERALGELHRCGLLEGSMTEAPGYSRRQATAKLAKIGGAALAPPLVFSVAIPSAAAAGSCVANDLPIANGGSCTALAGAFGTANAAAKCCSGTGPSTCYRGKTNSTFYCVGGSSTCAADGGNCHNGNGMPCCAGGDQSSTSGTSGNCSEAVCTQ